MKHILVFKKILNQYFNNIMTIQYLSILKITSTNKIIIFLYIYLH